MTERKLTLTTVVEVAAALATPGFEAARRAG